MKAGFVQFAPIFGEKEENLQKIDEIVLSHASADLLVLPELCTTGYLFKDKNEVKRFAEEVPRGKTIKRWEDLASKAGTYLVAGICEKTKNDAYYNSAVLIGPEGFIDVYRKIHLFDKEKELFVPGSGPFKVYNINGVRIGIIICFDWAFPEITRILAIHGAEIICHPANLVLPFAQTAMLTRSIENRVYTITANRIGTDDRTNTKLTFTGQSQIVDPTMKRLARASKTKEEVKIVSIEPKLAQNKMITANNHVFLDRRIDLYEPLLKNITFKNNK
jgi:predicted amidohydrolase